MDAIEMLKTHRAVRDYKVEPVPRKIIEDIVDCGRLAATAINIQPWEFVVVTDPEQLRRIARATHYGKFIADAPACVLVLCRDTKYYLEDCSGATESILLAARAHGLGSCTARAAGMPSETKDPVLLHHPTRKSVGYLGTVRLRDGRYFFRRKTGKFNAVTCWQFWKTFARSAPARLDGWW